jgi:hypothetical protein
VGSVAAAAGFTAEGGAAAVSPEEEATGEATAAGAAGSLRTDPEEGRAYPAVFLSTTDSGLPGCTIPARKGCFFSFTLPRG